MTEVNCRGWWFLDLDGSLPVHNQKPNSFIVSNVKMLDVQRLVGRIRLLMSPR